MKLLAYITSKLVVVFLSISTFVACNNNSGSDIITLKPGPDVQAEAQEALNTVVPGQTIEFEEGNYEFTRQLTMDEKSDIKIRGLGRDKTILSFSGQISGGNGLLITGSDNIVVRDLTIRDTPGDALKFQNSDGIVMYRVGTVWSGEPSENNGSYGLYPVLSSNILIDECYAYGASDAGIYVGQSDNAIIRNSTAEGNVAGIQIENTTNADVYGNTATDNSAGILVFDLPGLSQSGARTRVFDNTISNNGRGNFGPTGSLVAEIPAGTGVLVLATDDLEVFDNIIQENNVVGTGVFSYNSMIALGLASLDFDSAYNASRIYIHDNTFSRSNTYQDVGEQSFFGNLLVGSFGNNPIPDVMVDGFFDVAGGTSGSICIENNLGISFVNLNISDDFPNKLNIDASPHNCSMDALPAVQLNTPNF